MIPYAARDCFEFEGHRLIIRFRCASRYTRRRVASQQKKTGSSKDRPNLPIVCIIRGTRGPESRNPHAAPSWKVGT